MAGQLLGNRHQFCVRALQFFAHFSDHNTVAPNMSPNIAELFLDHSVRKLDQMTAAIDLCLTRLTPEQIWSRAAAHENAIGNLVLHLCGNITQLIGHCLAGDPDIRVAPQRFIKLVEPFDLIGIIDPVRQRENVGGIGLRLEVAEVARHDELYYRHAKPEISDYDYDLLKRELAHLEETFPELVEKKEESPTAQIGDDRPQILSIITGRFEYGLLVIGAHEFNSGVGVSATTNAKTCIGLTHLERNRSQRSLRWVSRNLERAHPIIPLMLAPHITPPHGNRISFDRLFLKCLSDGNPVLECPRFKVQIQRVPILADGEYRPLDSTVQPGVG